MFTIVQILPTRQNQFMGWAVLGLTGAGLALFAFFEDAAQYAGWSNWLWGVPPLEQPGSDAGAEAAAETATEGVVA